MKAFVSLLLLVCCQFGMAQCLSNNPYELYWNWYVLEFNFEQVSKNKIRTIEALTFKSKNGKFKNERKFYKVHFNENALPTKYEYFLESSVRDGLRYNPFWRKKNEFPKYKRWIYELSYDDQNRLINVVEKYKYGNFGDTSYLKLEFSYDEKNQVVLQKQFRYFFVNRNGDITMYEDEAEITKIEYLDENSGFIVSNSIFRLGDTVRWNKFPVRLIKFHFGDNTEEFVRNRPYDKNISMYYAGDTYSTIVRNDVGLRTKRVLNSILMYRGNILTSYGNDVVIYNYTFWD
jgi:hypothetical protein